MSDEADRPLPDDLRELFDSFAISSTRNPEIISQLLCGLWSVSSGVPKQAFQQVFADVAATQDRCSGSGPLFKLQLTHTCLAPGCGNTRCDLCKHNPERACTATIGYRNLSETELKVVCGARAEVHVTDRNGNIVDSLLLPPFQIQVCVIEKENCTEGVWVDPARYALLTFRKKDEKQERRLLQSCSKMHDAPPAHMHTDNFVYFPSIDGAPTAGSVTKLPDLMLMASGESVVKSKLPELALALRAVGLDLQPLDHLIQPVFSNPFKVATKRTRSNMKVQIPTSDTDVSKIEGIGGETKTKLSNLPAHCGTEFDVVENVGQLRELISMVNDDEQKRSCVMTALRMNKDTWDTVVAHTFKMVQADNKLRVFTRVAGEADPSRSVGLVFACARGKVELQKDAEAGIRGYVERRLGVEHFVHWSRIHWHDVRTFALETLLREAQAAWKEDSHPGWDWFRYNNATLEEVGAIEDSYPIPAGCAQPFQPAPGAAVAPTCLGRDVDTSTPAPEPMPLPPRGGKAPAAGPPMDPRLCERRVVPLGAGLNRPRVITPQGSRERGPLAGEPGSAPAALAANDTMRDFMTDMFGEPSTDPVGNLWAGDAVPTIQSLPAPGALPNGFPPTSAGLQMAFDNTKGDFVLQSGQIPHPATSPPPLSNPFGGTDSVPMMVDNLMPPPSFQGHSTNAHGLEIPDLSALPGSFNDSEFLGRGDSLGLNASPQPLPGARPRGFELPNASGSFRMPEFKRFNHNTSMDRSFNHFGSIDLPDTMMSGLGTGPPSRGANPAAAAASTAVPPVTTGAVTASPGNGARALNASDSGERDAPACFRTQPRNYDESESMARSQIELQQASFDFERMEGQDAPNPYFFTPDELA